MKGKTIARTGDFTGVLGISKNQERNLLSRLAQSGFIIRLRRGVYLLPEKIPSEGSYNPGTAYILEKLFEDLEGRYQLCGPACLIFTDSTNKYQICGMCTTIKYPELAALRSAERAARAWRPSTGCAFFIKIIFSIHEMYS